MRALRQAISPAHTGIVASMLLTLAFMGVPLVTEAETTDSGTTTVTFNIAEAIEVTSWPASTFELSSTATPGVPVVSGMLSMSVRSNTNWGVQVASDTASGYLREFDSGIGGYISGGTETGPLEWATNVGGPWTPLSSTPATIFTEQPPTGEEGASVGFVLRATPSFDDAPLTSSRVYRILLTYTAGVGY